MFIEKECGCLLIPHMEQREFYTEDNYNKKEFLNECDGCDYMPYIDGYEKILDDYLATYDMPEFETLSDKKRVLTSFGKLKRRIDREFIKKNIIGDISIDDDEFVLLIQYAQKVFMYKRNKYILNDKILCTAMVHIGIRYYNGNYWGHVKALLNSKAFNVTHQTWLGETCLRTLKLYNKDILNENDRVNTILMHGFVGNYHAGNLLNFLFAFYRIDLDRDLSRNDKDTMNALMEVMERNDNTGRTYLIVKQTADAIHTNHRGSKNRIRRLLRLIDGAFWGDELYRNSQNRLTVLFYQWRDNSPEFNFESNKSRGMAGRAGMKSLSSPYLKCDFKNYRFKLILPPQIIKVANLQDIWWDIKFSDSSLRIDCDVYEAVTGNKTEEKIVELNDDQLFCEKHIVLMNGEEKIRLFRNSDEPIKFFDKDGDSVAINSIGNGELFSFSRASFTPISAALIETRRLRSLVFSYFNFQTGDIVRLPDGKPISVGKKVEEGLMQRGLVEGIYATFDEMRIPVYNAIPSVMAKILPKRSNGTAVSINGVVKHLFDAETISDIELGDRSGEKGYLFNLKDYGCSASGIYEVCVDVPNDRSNRRWKFALINGLKYDFEDAPYIFKPAGTVKFDPSLQVLPEDDFIQDDPERNTYNFQITANHDSLRFNIEHINIALDVPMFSYRFDGGLWATQRPAELWHSEFPKMICIKYPSDKMKLIMDDQDSEDEEEQEATYERLKTKGIFECDVTRFRSWFDREKALKRILLEFPGVKRAFIDVITKSVVVSSIIKGDFEKERLIGSFDIIGKSNYCADISFGSLVLAEKVPIVEGHLEFASDMHNGKYTVSVFEVEDDNSGFGGNNYYLLKTCDCDLINPSDLSGKNIRIRNLKKGADSVFALRLAYSYSIRMLQKLQKGDRHRYTGELINNNLRNTPYKVNVYIHDIIQLKNMTITYIDEYGDPAALLFDHRNGEIVLEEQHGLRPAEKYRRYEYLFDDEYIFGFEFE